MDKINAVYAVENTIGGGMKNCEMTAAEVREKHGEVITYDLGKPQPYEVFSTWPEDIQREYLKKIYWTHGAGYKDIADMLGIPFQRVAALFNDYSLPRRPPHTRKTPEQKAAWKAFLMGKTLVKDTLSEETAQKLKELVKEEPLVLVPLKEENKDTISENKSGSAAQALLFAIEQLVHHSGAHVKIEITI